MAERVVRAHGPIVLLLVCLGVLYAATLDANGMFVWDEAEYASLARSVVRGEGFAISGVPNPLRPPVVPLAAAGSMLLVRSERDLVLKFPNLFFGLLAVFVVYWSARTEYGHLAGIVAGALLGLFPTFWRSTSMLMTEIPFMAFFTGAVVFFYAGLYRAPRFFSLSWLCFGLALLTRYTAVLFLPIALGFVAVALLTGPPEAARNVRSRGFVLGLLVVAAVVGPWLIRQHAVFGDALVGFKQASTQLQVFLPGVWQPWYFYPLQIPRMISWIPVVLLGLGLWWAVRSRDRFALHCLLVCAGVVTWFSVYRFKEIRQVTSILPFLAVLAALGITRFLVPRFSTRRAWVVLASVLVATLAMSGLQIRREFTRTVARGYPSFTHAMGFLREHSSPSAVVVGANYPQIHWYTERRTIDFPEEREFRQTLARSEWVIVTNFERGQRDYARGLLGKVTRDDVHAGHAAIFRDRRYFTALIRSSLLQERL